MTKKEVLTLEQPLLAKLLLTSKEELTFCYLELCDINFLSLTFFT